MASVPPAPRMRSKALVRLILGAALPLVVTTAVARAQGATFNHSVIIERTLREIGGASKLASAGLPQRVLLAQHLAARGQFHLDLWEYERVIVRDHALHRDSIAKHGGPAIPAATYFLARAYQESGLFREAAAAYAAIGSNVPSRIRSLADEWEAALSGKGGWQRDLAKFRQGGQVNPAPCPEDSKACALFEAIVADDADAMLALQRDLGRTVAPDYRETLRERGASYTVDFYDPVTPYLLGVSDYALAARVLKGMKSVEGAEALRGIALLRSGHFEEAEPVLRSLASGRSAPPQVLAAYGELLALGGNSGDAEKVWNREASSAFEVMEARSRLQVVSPRMRQTVVAAYKAGLDARGITKGQRRAPDMLVRTLLHVDSPKEALDVLDDLLPPSVGHDLRFVMPSTLVLSSRARYVLGHRDGLLENYPLSRGELASLAGAFPVVSPVLYLLQQLTAPPNFGELRSDE